MSERFSDMVQRTFRFLQDAGFRLVHCDSRSLQYETSEVFVSVEWDARSGELDTFFGLQPRQSKPQNVFSFSDLLDIEVAEEPKRRTPFQVAEESRLLPFLEKLAADTRTYASSALAGDRMYFRRLETFTDAKAQINMRDMELRRVRSEADKAWRERDFDKVLSLYASIEAHLSESERKKLIYARQHQLR